MNVEHRKRIIQGIVLVNLSIFLASIMFFTERRSFSWKTGNHIDYFFSMLSARTGWDSCFMILLCTCILSFGIYRICVKPLSGAERKSAEV
jgi:hypothetical protein